MESLMDLINITSSIASLILAVIAISLSLYFFVSSKNTEKAVSNSLTKIEVQASTLERITGRQLDRLTKFVTNKKQPQADPDLKALLDILGNLAQGLTADMSSKVSKSVDVNALREELLISYLIMYFYTAQTNYWSKHYLPKASDFSKEDEYHLLVRRIVDTSAEDFKHVKNILSQVPQEDIKRSPVYNWYLETEQKWSNRVQSSTEIFSEKE